MSGHGIEVEFFEEDEGQFILIDNSNLLKQRCYIELGLNWFPFATGNKIEQQLKELGYE